MVQLPDLALELCKRAGMCKSAKQLSGDEGLHPADAEKSDLLTSGGTILLFFCSEKLKMELIILPDQPSIFYPVRLQEGVVVLAVSFRFARG